MELNAQNPINDNKNYIRDSFESILQTNRQKLVPFSKKGKFGYMYPNKKVAIKPKFQHATFFDSYSKIAKIKVGNEYFRVHANGFIETSDEYYKRIEANTNVEYNKPTHANLEEISEWYPAKKVFEADHTGRLKYTMPLFEYNEAYVININGIQYASLYKRILPSNLTEKEIKKIKIGGSRSWSAYPRLAGLVDKDNNVFKNFDFVFKTLKRYKNDENNKTWFYFIDKEDNSGFINLKGEKKLVNEFKSYPFSSSNKLELAIVKTFENKIGVIDFKTFKWFLKPSTKEITEIIAIKNTVETNKSKSRHNYSIYFKVKTKDSHYYFNKEKGDFIK